MDTNVLFVDHNEQQTVEKILRDHGYTVVKKDSGNIVFKPQFGYEVQSSYKKCEILFGRYSTGLKLSLAFNYDNDQNQVSMLVDGESISFEELPEKLSEFITSSEVPF